jgi:hypothetical protein
MSNPAEQIIEKLGGFKAVSKYLRVHITRTHRWTYPKERGGTDGRIPPKHQERLMRFGQKIGVQITPDMFFKDYWKKSRGLS